MEAQVTAEEEEEERGSRRSKQRRRRRGGQAGELQPVLPITRPHHSWPMRLATELPSTARSAYPQLLRRKKRDWTSCLNWRPLVSSCCPRVRSSLRIAVTITCSRREQSRARSKLGRGFVS